MSQSLGPSPPTRRTSMPEVPKLRNSCGSCASSKLKCSKEKPKCSRCAKRGLACDYFLVKKAGRKPNNHSSTSSTSSSTSCLNVPPPPPPPPAPTPPYSLEAVHQQSSQLHMSDPSDMLEDIFGPIDQPMCTTFANTDTTFGDYFSSPMSLSTDAFDLNVFEDMDLLPTTTNDNCDNAFKNLPDAFWGSKDTVVKVLTHPCTDTTPEPLIFSSTEPYQPQQVHSTGPACSCLGQALALMRQMSAPSSPNACTTWSTQGLEPYSGKPSIQAVIAQNKNTIVAMSTTLDCSCLQDGYLLTVMSLIIFQVLGWYAAVARGAPSVQLPYPSRSRTPSFSDQAPSDSITIGNFCLEGEDSARMTAQLVLAELHRVRRLIDQLSPKLNLHAEKNGGVEGSGALESRDMHGETALPLSAGMYNQMHIDLRRRLKSVALEIIDLLKRL